jgi:hypothetical protein
MPTVLFGIYFIVGYKKTVRERASLHIYNYCGFCSFCPDRFCSSIGFFSAHRFCTLVGFVLIDTGPIGFVLICFVSEPLK